MGPLRRVVDRKHERYTGWVVTLGCGHKKTVDKKGWRRERHCCVQCPPGEDTTVERPPLRDVLRAGIDKDGPFEVLECKHTLYNPHGKAQRRRCPDCLERSRSG
jgi:hypothetical protein